MLCFIWIHRFRLRNEIPSILAVIISPPVYFRNFARPVTVSGADRRCPFQRSGIPWISCFQFSSLENGIEEIEDKHQLQSKNENEYNRDENIQVIELVEG